MSGNSPYRGRFHALAAVGMLVIGLTACNTHRVVQGECRPVNGADVCM